MHQKSTTRSIGQHPRGGAADQAVDQGAEVYAGVFGGFGEKAAGGEAGEGVDFQEIGFVDGIRHDVDSREVAGADDLVGAASQVAAVFDDFGGKAGFETVFGVGGAIFGFVVEKFPLGDDADWGEGFFFEEADGEFDAVDEFLDECGFVAG